MQLGEEDGKNNVHTGRPLGDNPNPISWMNVAILFLNPTLMIDFLFSTDELSLKPQEPPKNGTVSAGNWKFYFVELPVATHLRFDLFLTSLSGDTQVKFYLDYNKHPTHASYVEIKGKKLKEGKWFVGVLGIQGINEVSYTISMNYSIKCPNNCNEHGTCDQNATCLCQLPYYGPDCSAKDTVCTKVGGLPIEFDVFLKGCCPCSWVRKTGKIM